LATIIDQANKYGAQINDAANLGDTQSTKYDPSNPLAQQLQYVAQMISGGLQTKVYILNINGFDTHDSQVYIGNTTEGTHADLLKMVSDAVEAFQDDLDLLGISNRVAGFTFSEFGRQIASNASRGTDHGDAGPMFVFGTCISQSVLGSNPVIPSTIVNQAAVPMEFDFRDIYASVLKDWFGVDTNQIQSLFEHSVTYHKVLDGCGTVDVAELDDSNEFALDYAIVFPNPYFVNATLRLNSENENVKIRVVDQKGSVVADILDQELMAGRHDIVLNIAHLPIGNYFVRIDKASGTVVKIILKGK
jgi:hypothetical protein